MDNFILRKRSKIDRLDKKIVSLLEKRFEVVGELQDYKRKKRISREDKSREKEIRKKFESSELSQSFLNRFFDLLFSEGKKWKKKN